MNDTFDPDGDKLKEYCGIVGVYLTNHDDTASRLAYYGLQSLQHRGQESTGIAVADGTNLDQLKGMGLVADVYNKDNLSALKGNRKCPAICIQGKTGIPRCCSQWKSRQLGTNEGISGRNRFNIYLNERL